MSKPLRISICVPAHDNVPAPFMYDFARLCAHTSATLVAEGLADISIIMVQGAPMHEAREELARTALERGSTHVFWLDSGMRFPKDALIQLLARNEPVVGANYVTSGVPPTFVAVKEMGLGEESPERVVTDEDSEGLEEAQAIGFGVLLMQARVLESIAEDGPFFGFEYLPEREQWVGEDVYLCRKLAAKGWKIQVDHDLSKQCSHIGQLEYRVEHAAALAEPVEV